MSEKEVANRSSGILLLCTVQRLLGTGALMTALLLGGAMAAALMLASLVGAVLSGKPLVTAAGMIANADMSLVGFAYALGLILYILERTRAELAVFAHVRSATDLGVVLSRLTAALTPSGRRALIGCGVGLATLIDVITYSQLPQGTRLGAAASPMHFCVFPFFAFWWCTILYVVVISVRTAELIANVAQEYAVVDLLHVDSLAPLVSTGTRLSLLGFGALALLPMQALVAGHLAIQNWLPTVAVVSGFSLFLLIRPAWGVSATIRRAKVSELQRLAVEIGYAGHRSFDHITSERLYRLLNYRQQVREASEWPLSQSAVTQFVVYIVIPPMAWAGAGLIQLAMTAILGR